MNIVFKWQTSCVSNAVAYSLLQLWRCPVMELPFMWSLSSSTVCLVLVALPMHQCLCHLPHLQVSWWSSMPCRVTGGQGEADTAVTMKYLPFVTAKWLPRIFPVPFLWKWEQPVSAHPDLANVLIALWRAQVHDMSYASFVQLLAPAGTSIFWESISLHAVCLKHGTTAACSCSLAVPIGFSSLGWL